MEMDVDPHEEGATLPLPTGTDFEVSVAISIFHWHTNEVVKHLIARRGESFVIYSSETNSKVGHSFQRYVVSFAHQNSKKKYHYAFDLKLDFLSDYS